MTEEVQDVQSLLQEQFEAAARGVAREFAFDLHDLRQAYADKPDRLRSVFNEMETLKDRRMNNVFWTALTTFVFFPLAIVPVIFFIRNDRKIARLGETVGADISINKRHAAPA